MEALLRAEALHATLGGAEILRGVDLELHAGEITGVLGPSGAGKTTLFRVLVGELAGRAGRVWLGERDVTRAPLWVRARAGLGYVPQTPSVLMDVTVADNLRTFERVARAKRRPPAERAAELGLERRLHVAAGELSGGERRRLEILRALVAEPRVLVLDEPLTGVDPAAAAQLGALLRARAATGATIVLADHRIREALSMCDRAVLLADGAIEVDAPAARFADDPAVKRRYLG